MIVTEKKGTTLRERAVTALVKTRFSTLERNGELSGAHSFGHVDRVGKYAKMIAVALGADVKTAELAYAAGLLHDYVRSKAETTEEALDDETLSARQARPLLEKIECEGSRLFDEGDISTITTAIHTNRVPREILADEKTRHAIPTGTDLVRLAVWLADKTEANGGYVAARRGQFVAGERYNEGDLKKWRDQLTPALQRCITPHVAFLMESYVRRYIKNDAAMYPRWFEPVSDALFNQQRRFVTALYTATGLTEEKLERLMLLSKYPGVKREQITRVIANRSSRPDAISRDAISRVKEKHANAAKVLVDHFSHATHRRMDTAKAIRRFRPATQEERRWHNIMTGYLGGNLEAKIRRIKLA